MKNILNFSGSLLSYIFIVFFIFSCSYNYYPTTYKNWTTYAPSNSGIPSNCISSLTIDKEGNKWIGTVNAGLAKFDDENWVKSCPYLMSIPGFENKFSIQASNLFK